ncbi:MAG: hypothetical protein Q4B06_00630 [Candidatus Saccharibacteria bacterium]|nr:hypothetical protein [Candidatus Saccharibacteria bacterium]
MHPRAQNRLLDSLKKIASQSQVFIVTHSPYLLKKYKKDTHSLNVFSKNGLFNKVEESDAFDLFGSSSPTWGEINYYAFGVISVEFHNELYGFVQTKAILENEKNYFEDSFEQYLVGKGVAQDKAYVRLKKDGTTQNQTRTLPTLIRNTIHHPENTNNGFTDEDLKSSIELLIPLAK